MKMFAIHPQTSIDTEEYWRCLREHKARLQKCEGCLKFRFPPMPSCPYCGTLGGKWTAISGDGTIYSWTVINRSVDPRFSSELPIVLALVKLKEGPRIACRVLGCEPEEVEADIAVKLRYDDIDENLTLLNCEISQQGERNFS